MPATLALLHLWFLSISIMQDDSFADFGDLGKQLLGGFVIAVIVAVAYAFIKLRWRDQKPSTQFISISSVKGPDESPKVAEK